MNKYIDLTLKEAEKALKKNEVPIGAVIVRNNKIIAKAHNRRKKKNVVLFHAEIIAILKANKKIKDWRLDDCDMYVTLEPCEMCEKVIKESRIRNVFFLVKRLDCKKQYSKTRLKHLFDTDNSYLNEYKKKLNAFFKNIR